MTTFQGEHGQLKCVECSSVVENIDPCRCPDCGSYFCLGCFDSHKCPLAPCLPPTPEQWERAQNENRCRGLSEAAEILTNLPLDYLTERDHEISEYFVERATTAILKRYVELGGKIK